MLTEQMFLKSNLKETCSGNFTLKRITKPDVWQQ